MSQTVTFFRNRQQDSGRTYQFDLEAPPNRRYRVFVYSRAELPGAVLKSRQLGRDSIDEEMNNLAVALDRDGKGGAFAVTYVESGSLFLFAHPVPSAGGAAPFQNLGLLLPGKPLQLEALRSDFRSLPSGAHALVPVDREAEESLRGFQEYLGYLPLDLESLILHTIRKPSLETRMARVEGKVFPKEEDNSSGSSRLSRLIHRNVPLWPALATLLVLVLLNTGQLYLLYQRVESWPGGSAVTSGNDRRKIDERGQKGGQPGSGGTEETPAADRAIYSLLKAMRAKAVPAFKTLDSTHFASLKSEVEVTEALKSKSETRPLLLGLMKLEALRKDPTAANALLASSDNLTQVKEFFRQDSHLNDSSIKAAFAALSCIAYGSPGIPTTMNGTSLPLAFAEDQSCDSHPLADVVPGIQTLAGYVASR